MASRHAQDAPRASTAAPPPARRSAVRLSTLDLNLLLVFDALYAERSVTRAGHRLGLSQSAVSHALGRLRDRVGDALFTRGGDGMVPTPRARVIAGRVHSALAEMQAALADTGFDPAVSERCFTIAADPYVRAILLPRLIAVLRRRAPGIELRVLPGFSAITETLDSGGVDLAVASYREVPERFGSLDLLHERHVWALRADHPAAASPLTLDRLAALPHLIRVIAGDEDATSALPGSGRGLVRRAIQDDGGAFARALAGLGSQPTVRLTIPDSYAALAVVGESDLAALVPERIGQALSTRFGLVLFDPPYPSPPIPLSMVWEHGRGADPAMEWLRALIQEVAHSLDPVPSPKVGSA